MFFSNITPFLKSPSHMNDSKNLHNSQNDHCPYHPKTLSSTPNTTHIIITTARIAQKTRVTALTLASRLLCGSPIANTTPTIPKYIAKNMAASICGSINMSAYGHEKLSHSLALPLGHHHILFVGIPQNNWPERGFSYPKHLLVPDSKSVAEYNVWLRLMLFSERCRYSNYIHHCISFKAKSIAAIIGFNMYLAATMPCARGPPIYIGNFVSPPFEYEYSTNLNSANRLRCHYCPRSAW